MGRNHVPACRFRPVGLSMSVAALQSGNGASVTGTARCCVLLNNGISRVSAWADLEAAVRMPHRLRRSGPLVSRRDASVYARNLAGYVVEIPRRPDGGALR